jgi:hypothetical protein
MISSIIIFLSISPILLRFRRGVFSAVFPLVVTHKREHSVDAIYSPLSSRDLFFQQSLHRTLDLLGSQLEVDQQGGTVTRYSTSLSHSPTISCVGACQSDWGKMSLGFELRKTSDKLLLY